MQAIQTQGQGQLGRIKTVFKYGLLLAVAVPLTKALTAAWANGGKGSANSDAWKGRRDFEDRLIALGRSIASSDLTQESNATFLALLRDAIKAHDQAETVVFDSLADNQANESHRAASDLLAEIQELEEIPLDDSRHGPAVFALRKSLASYLMRQRALYRHLGKSMATLAARELDSEFRHEKKVLESRDATMAAGG